MPVSCEVKNYIYIQSQKVNLFAVATLEELTTLMPALEQPDITTQVQGNCPSLQDAWKENPFLVAQKALEISQQHTGEEGFLEPDIKIVQGPASLIR